MTDYTLNNSKTRQVLHTCSDKSLDLSNIALLNYQAARRMKRSAPKRVTLQLVAELLTCLACLIVPMGLTLL